MRTHQQALYVRVPGDKFRPLKIQRPTLQQVGARLRVLTRRIKAAEKHLRLKQGEQEPRFLVALRRHREGLKAYVANIGKEMQDPIEGARGLRIGRPKKEALVLFPVGR